MIIKAKFNSKCPVCGKEIQIGQEVSWNPGSKAIVLKINGRIPEGKILSLEDIEEIGYTLKLMVRNS